MFLIKEKSIGQSSKQKKYVETDSLSFVPCIWQKSNATYKTKWGYLYMMSKYISNTPDQIVRVDYRNKLSASSYVTFNWWANAKLVNFTYKFS